MKLIVDAHLDLAWNALSYNRDQTEPLADLCRREAGMTDERGRGHATVSLPQMRTGGVALCVATLLARANPDNRPVQGFYRTDLDHGTQSIAHAVAHGQLAYYQLLEQQGRLRIIHSKGQLDAHWQTWLNGAAENEPIGIILSMEGTDPIVTPGQAEHWFSLGLRAAGLTHYGDSAHAGGTGCSGPLTSAGIELLGHFEKLGIALDVTHLCDASFFDALDRFGGPVLASHHNCRALVPGERQLTDEQINLLIQRQAVIGAVLDAWMLYPNWQHGKTSPQVVGLQAVADHIDHICQIAGATAHCAIGSDLDGGFGTDQTPRDIDTIADLQKLAPILAARGYSDDDINGIFHGNWLRFFHRVLPD